MPDNTDSSSPILPPHAPLPHFYGQEGARREFVTHLFDRTAKNYDRTTSLLSFGTGRIYRKHVLRQAGLSKGMTTLDVACGTGQLMTSARDIVQRTGKVVGIDLSRGMLGEARRLGCQDLIQGITEDLPFQDGLFDVVCMGYALRHVQDLRETFREFFRVLKPGGRLLLLEISKPQSWFPRVVAMAHIGVLIPKIVRVSTGDKNSELLMKYYWKTIEQCVSPEVILAELKAHGFVNSRVNELLFGCLRDYSAVKPV